MCNRHKAMAMLPEVYRLLNMVGQTAELMVSTAAADHTRRGHTRASG